MITWEVVPLLIGFLLGFLLYSKFNFRGGGVLVIPLLAIYLIKFPLMFPIILLTSALSFFIIDFIYARFMIYGRRLLYLSLTIGMIVSIIVQLIFNLNVGWYAMLIPGLLSYNIHREVNSTTKAIKSLLFGIAYLILILISAILSYYYL